MTGKKEIQVRKYFAQEFGGEVPTGKVLDLFQNFQNHPLGEGISYSLFNGVIKKLRGPQTVAEVTQTSRVVATPSAADLTAAVVAIFMVTKKES